MRRLTRDSCLASVFFVARLGRSWRATKKPCNDFLSPRPPWRGETRIGLLERRKGKRERERQIDRGREGRSAGGERRQRGLRTRNSWIRDCTWRAPGKRLATAARIVDELTRASREEEKKKNLSKYIPLINEISASLTHRCRSTSKARVITETIRSLQFLFFSFEFFHPILRWRKVRFLYLGQQRFVKSHQDPNSISRVANSSCIRIIGWARVFVDSDLKSTRLCLSLSFYVAAFDRQPPPWLSSPLSSFSTHVRVSRLELVRRAIVR